VSANAGRFQLLLGLGEAVGDLLVLATGGVERVGLGLQGGRVDQLVEVDGFGFHVMCSFS
jgi:hypothetical protein